MNTLVYDGGGARINMVQGTVYRMGTWGSGKRSFRRGFNNLVHLSKHDRQDGTVRTALW